MGGSFCKCSKGTMKRSLPREQSEIQFIAVPQERGSEGEVIDLTSPEHNPNTQPTRAIKKLRQELTTLKRCKECTFLNKEEALQCSMCLSLFIEEEKDQIALRLSSPPSAGSASQPYECTLCHRAKTSRENECRHCQMAFLDQEGNNQEAGVQCKLCTFSNPLEASCCKMCATPFSPSGEDVEVQVRWVCPLCQTESHVRSASCEGCFFPRPSAAADKGAPTGGTAGGGGLGGGGARYPFPAGGAVYSHMRGVESTRARTDGLLPPLAAALAAQHKTAAAGGAAAAAAAGGGGLFGRGRAPGRVRGGASGGGDREAAPDRAAAAAVGRRWGGEGAAPAPDPPYRLCSPVAHYSQRTQAEGLQWSCGYRNIQMLCDALLRRPEYRRVLFEGAYARPGAAARAPGVRALQGWLERAWALGFDPAGAALFPGGRVAGGEAWIGATEAVALLRSFGVRAQVVDFDESFATMLHKSGVRDAAARQRSILEYMEDNRAGAPAAAAAGAGAGGGKGAGAAAAASGGGGGGKGGRGGAPPPASSARPALRRLLAAWVWRYLDPAGHPARGPAAAHAIYRDALAAAAAAAAAPGGCLPEDEAWPPDFLPPLYFQHQGHSRTIVGMEKLSITKAGKTTEKEHLILLDPAMAGKDLKKVLDIQQDWQKMFKRGLHTLNKSAYQIVYIQPGIMSESEREASKKLRADGPFNLLSKGLDATSPLSSNNSISSKLNNDASKQNGVVGSSSSFSTYEDKKL